MKTIGRYILHDKIAQGGMATVHLGRLQGPIGFSKTVAIKRLHPQFALDPQFVTMFVNEARLAARIQHPNVVATLDVLVEQNETFMVMEFVRGEALSKLIAGREEQAPGVPPRILSAIVSNALAGLQAAHDATDENGKSLSIVHRDVSPQNILVGIDGVARVLDFGVAKAANAIQDTKTGETKGKLRYMPPEQLRGEAIDRSADVYAMGIVLFEALTGERMFPGELDIAQIPKILAGQIRLPGTMDLALAKFDPIVAQACALQPSDRFLSARAMARALESVEMPALQHEVGDWVGKRAQSALTKRAELISQLESQSDVALVEASPATEDVTDILSAVSESNRQAPRPWPHAKVLVGALTVAALIAGLMLFRKSTPVAAAPVPVPILSTSALSSPMPERPKEIAEPVLAPLPTATATIAAEATRPKNAAQPGPTRPAIKAQPRVDCSQPTVIDSSGHVHFRKECL